MPRHPPCALSCLTSNKSACGFYLALFSIALENRVLIEIFFISICVNKTHFELFSSWFVILGCLDIYSALFIVLLSARIHFVSSRCWQSPNPSSHLCHRQINLSLSLLLVWQCSLLYQNLCMKFSRYKSHPLRGSFKSSFGTSAVFLQLWLNFYQSLETSIYWDL